MRIAAGDSLVTSFLYHCHEGAAYGSGCSITQDLLNPNLPLLNIMVSDWVIAGVTVAPALTICGFGLTLFLHKRSQCGRSVRNPKPVLSSSLYLASLLTQSIARPIARRSRCYQANNSRWCARRLCESSS